MKSETKKWRGGARIEQFGITCPFAALTATKRSVVLKVTFAGIFEFTPEQVVKVVPWGFLPFLREGIRIRHNIASYPDNIVFASWNWQNIIKELGRYGYKVED